MQFKKNIIIIFICVTSLIFFSCDPEEPITTPKPRGYFRIDFPKHKYILYDSLCPFVFETPKYSWVLKDVNPKAEPCWLNIFYPRFGAIMHMSYKVVDGNIKQYLLDSDQFARNHTVKANGMTENIIAKDSAKVYGLMYEIGGNAATNLQFYVTDSVHHFMRGSLYFNVRPNIDSIQPVINFLKEDLIHMLQTFRWKDSRIDLKNSTPKKQNSQL